MKNISRRTSSGANLGPPDPYEYLVDNFLFKASNLERETINEPLRGDHNANITIIGGGDRGLPSALNTNRRIPEKKITLLEGVCCGSGLVEENSSCIFDNVG